MNTGNAKRSIKGLYDKMGDDKVAIWDDIAVFEDWCTAQGFLGDIWASLFKIDETKPYGPKNTVITMANILDRSLYRMWHRMQAEKIPTTFRHYKLFEHWAMNQPQYKLVKSYHRYSIEFGKPKILDPKTCKLVRKQQRLTKSEIPFYNKYLHLVNHHTMRVDWNDYLAFKDWFVGEGYAVTGDITFKVVDTRIPVTPRNLRIYTSKPPAGVSKLWNKLLARELHNRPGNLGLGYVNHNWDWEDVYQLWDWMNEQPEFDPDHLYYDLTFEVDKVNKIVYYGEDVSKLVKTQKRGSVL